MKDQWLAMEHYRLHLIEEWPDGPKKEGALAAIRSSLDSLTRLGAKPVECGVCSTHRYNQRYRGLRLAA